MFGLTQPVLSPVEERDPPTPQRGDRYADIVERLFGEYVEVLALSTISDIIAGCHRDLAGSPQGAMPELTERLARVRLEQARVSAA